MLAGKSSKNFENDKPSNNPSVIKTDAVICVVADI